jgi:hypothetical protein
VQPGKGVGFGGEPTEAQGGEMPVLGPVVLQLVEAGALGGRSQKRHVQGAPQGSSYPGKEVVVHPLVQRRGVLAGVGAPVNQPVGTTGGLRRGQEQLAALGYLFICQSPQGRADEAERAGVLGDGVEG